MYNSHRKKFTWKIMCLQKKCHPVVCGLEKKTCTRPKEPDVIFTAVRVHDWRKTIHIANSQVQVLLFLEPDPEVGHTRLHRFWRQFSKVCLQICTVLRIVYASCWSRAEKIRAFMASDRSWFFGITPIKSFRLQGFYIWYPRYRASEGKVFFLIGLWEKEIYKLDYIWR